MVGKSHQLVGFTFVYTTALLLPVAHLNVQTIIASILCISLGSLTPDLDSPENKLYTLIPIGQALFAQVGEKAFGKHRAVSHSIIGVIIFGYLSHFLIYMIPPENGLPHLILWSAFMISLISHLIADAVTIDGIPLLWPIKWRFGFPPFKFMRMKTGGWIELFIVRPLLVLFLIYMTYAYWAQARVLFGF